MKSRPYTLNATDLPSLLKAGGVGVLIAVLSYFSEFITQIDFGQWTSLVMGVIPPILTAAIRFLKDNDAE